MRRLPVLALALGGCSFAATTEDWQAQLAPAGPCYEANLLDGLDTTSTAEAHAVFACLNATGALDAYSGFDLALDAETRDGAVGLVLARWLADLPSFDLSLAGLVDSAMGLLEDATELFDLLHLGLELVYGAPWPWLGSAVPLNSASALEDGLLVPALPIVGDLARVLLEEDLAPLQTLADAARADVTPRLLWTLAGVARSDDRTLAGLADDWPAHLADLLDRTSNADNDRWSAASGDSIRDLADALFTYEYDDRLTLDHVASTAEPLLSDTRLRDALAQVLTEQIDAGRVDALPVQILYLTSVDTWGGSLEAGEDSALVALLRLLNDANTDVDCTIDLVLFDIDIALGNLSVSFLELLAKQDPSTVDGGVSLLGQLLGVSLTDDILYGIADTGVCPAIDRQLVDDLHAVDRLADPQTDELLYVLLDALAALDDLGQVAALVNVVGEVHQQGLVPPVEEIVRDAADTAIAADLVALLPVLLDPWAYHDATYLPAGIPPLDFPTAWDTAAALLTPDSGGATPIAALSGPIKALLSRDDTWTLVHRLGDLLAEPDALSRGALDYVADLCEADPALESLTTLGDTLEDRALLRPLLVLVEADALRDALAQTELTRPGPIPFTAGLIHGGTLQLLLDTLELFTTLLPEEAE